MQANALSLLLVALISAGLGFGFGMLSGDEQPTPPPAADGFDSGTEQRTPDRTRLSSGARSSGVAVEASARGPDFSANAEDAARRFAVEPTERRAGSGQVQGTVRSADGSPLANVLVIANADEPPKASYGRKSRGAGMAPPNPSTLEEALKSAAERWHRTQQNRFETRTDANGNYLLDGLPDSGRLRMRAFLEDWKLSALGVDRVNPGATLDFLATPVHGLAFDIVLPDGTRPDRAAIQVSSGRRNWSSYEWKPDDDRIKFDDRVATVRAYAAPFPASNTAGKGVPAEFLSDEVNLTEEHFAAGVVRVELKVQNGIRVTFADPQDAETLNTIALYQLPENRPNGAPDWESPMERDWHRGQGVVFTGLEPGLYVIGAGDGRSKPAASARVQVDEGFVDAVLESDPTRKNDFLTIHCENPDGQPLFGCRFEVQINRSQWSHSKGSADARPSGAGEYRIAFEELSQDEFRYENWQEDASVSLIVKHRSYGEQILNLSEGQREATVRFERPASLTVSLTGYTSTEPSKQKVWIEVVRADDPSKDGWSSRSEERMKSPDAQGRVVFPKLSPGLVELRLVTNRNSYPRQSIAKMETELRPGPQEVSFPMPILHELIVRASDLDQGSDLYLMKVQEEQNPWGNYHEAKVDETGRARFVNLAPGKYRLSDPRGGTMDVSVPSGELLYVPKRNDCLRVTINDRKGSLFQAGLRGGDVIIAVGGVSLTSENLTRERQKLYESSGMVTVLRDEQTLQFDLTGIYPSTGNDVGGWIQDGMR